MSELQPKQYVAYPRNRLGTEPDAIDRVRAIATLYLGSGGRILSVLTVTVFLEIAFEWLVSPPSPFPTAMALALGALVGIALVIIVERNVSLLQFALGRKAFAGKVWGFGFVGVVLAVGFIPAGKPFTFLIPLTVPLVAGVYGHRLVRAQAALYGLKIAAQGLQNPEMDINQVVEDWRSSMQRTRSAIPEILYSGQRPDAK